MARGFAGGVGWRGMICDVVGMEMVMVMNDRERECVCMWRREERDWAPQGAMLKERKRRRKFSQPPAEWLLTHNRYRQWSGGKDGSPGTGAEVLDIMVQASYIRLRL